jgi:hypothetical protein
MDSNLLFTHFTSAAIFVMVMQQLKRAPWFPWLRNEGQIWLKRGSSIVYAICVHTGISHVWNPGPQVGSHVLMITIPALSVIAVSLWHVVGQYALQETVYQASTKSAPDAPAPVAASPAVHQSPVTSH